MERTYKLDARLANICCDKLKHIAYYEVAEVLNEFARQDAEFDAKEKETAALEKAAAEALTPEVMPSPKRRTGLLKRRH